MSPSSKAHLNAWVACRTRTQQLLATMTKRRCVSCDKKRMWRNASDSITAKNGSSVVQVMQIYQMDAMNFHFVAHPNAWVVHRPHAPSSGYNHTFTGEAYTLKHKPTDHLWKMERIAKVASPAIILLIL